MAILDLSSPATFPHVVTNELSATPGNVRQITLPDQPYYTQITLRTRTGTLRVSTDQTKVDEAVDPADVVIVSGQVPRTFRLGAIPGHGPKRAKWIYVSSDTAGAILEIVLERGEVQ